MDRSIPVSQIMIHRNKWPHVRADTSVQDTIKLMRIITEEKKIEHGYSTPLVLDDDYKLLGLVRLVDLLRSVRYLCDVEGEPGVPGNAIRPVSELVIPFAETVAPDDSILDVLDKMIEHGVSLVPVMEEGKLKGVVRLSNVFGTMAAVLFGEEAS